ncbi:RNF4 ligase, partial [Polyodon spathula]|nr:RNF4 ligase [Polyodon spathula]
MYSMDCCLVSKSKVNLRLVAESVACTEEGSSRTGPGRRRSGGGESYVLSSDEEGLTEREVYVSALVAKSAFVPSVVNSNCSRSTSGTVSCPICMDSYAEILQSGRLIVSTKCGHLFCSQCLRNALKHAHSCPTCRKKLTHKQYHPIYI